MKKVWKQLRDRLAPKGLTAYNLYCIIKYGEVLDAAGIKSKIIKDITEIIQNRANSKILYSTIIDMDTDNTDILDYVQEYFQSRGFECKLITSKDLSFIDSPKLYISWKMNM